MLYVTRKIFSFIKNFFFILICFFSERMLEHKDLEKKKRERERENNRKGAKIMVVGAINASVCLSHLF
jgi:hypothetical protein